MKPSKEFTIKLLSDADYLKLPYPGARDSLGMSVMDTKTAYIRRTGVKELDDGTIRHEFDELMQQQSPHEENGIRYKFLIELLALALGSAATEAVVKGTVSKAQGGSFAEGAKQGAVSGAAGGATAGLLGPVAGGLTGPLANAAGSAASGAVAKKPEFPGFPSTPSAPTNLSETTKAFAPQSSGPLSFSDFNTSLAKLDKNASAQQGAVRNRFRGQGDSASNTAFGGALSSAKTSSQLARTQFLDDQKKLGSTFT